MAKKRKQSLMIAALTSSFGIFISKALGLLYYSPLSSLAGEENMAFYSIAYTYYDLLLKISSAGIPFAIAALVSRYYAKKDYKTVLLIKKMGISIVMGLTFIVALGFLFLSGPLARQSMGSGASVEDITHLQNIFLILLIAVILVPFLSAIRGYYQGLKRLDLYGSSQALEQLVRVACIIGLGFLFVRILNFDSIYAIYMAIAAAGIAAFVTIIFFLRLTKADDKHINQLIKSQESKAVSKDLLLQELISLSVPYLLISFLGSLSSLINSTFFMDTVAKAGMDVTQAKLEMGILLANCNKLSSIPQVLTLGFSAGLVPYLSESLEQQDVKKLNNQIIQLIETVLYILVPAVCVFLFFGKDIYYIMYGNNNLEVGAKLFRWYCLVTFTDTIAPIFSSIMITLRLKKEATLALLASCFVKLVTFFILVRIYGANGMTFSTAISSLFVIIAYMFILKKCFGTKFTLTLRKFLFIIIASLLMIAPVKFVHILIGFEYTSRIVDIVILSICGIFMLLIYYEASVFFNLPQQIFNIKTPSVKAILKRFRK